MAETKVPAIKNIPAKTDPETKLALESIKEALEVRLGRRGDPIDRAVTLRELIDSGLATQLAQSPYNPNTGATGFGPIGEKPGNVEVPPTPINLRAETLFKDIALFWHTSRSFNPPYGNHASTEIWRSQTEDLSSAIAAGPLAGGVGGFSYTDTSTEYNRTYYYWVRYISTDGVPGPWSNMASATTVEDIGATMALLSEDLSNLPGYNLITTTAAAATVIKQSSSPSTRADGSGIGAFDIWFDTDDSQVYTRNAANNAWVAGRDSTLVSVFGATSFTGNTLTAAMASAQADVITVTNAQNATASSLGTLSSTVGGHTSSISSLSTTTANLNGDVNAMFVLTVATETDGSKSAAGMVIGSNASSGSGAQSFVQFQADKFAIWNGTNAKVAPFIIDNGVVFIDQARIKDGAIVNAKIADATIESGKIVSLVADKITEGTMSAARISGGVIQSTDLSTGGSTTINGANITTGTVSANRIDTAILRATDVASGGSTTIDGARITTGAISADRISTTDLILPSLGGIVSGSTVGNFNNNSKRYAEIITVGTGAGLYQGYVRLVGGTGQVKTIHLLFSDGTVNTTVTSGGADTSALSDSSSGVAYKTPDIEHLNTSISQSRLTSSADTANLPIVFRYTGSGTVKCYIYGQGDGGARQIGSADVRFVKFSAS